MLRIDGPERVSWDVAPSLLLRCSGRRLDADDLAITAVRQETGAVLSGRALPAGPADTLDLRQCLNIPWKDGTYLLTLLSREEASNRIRVCLEKSEFSFRDFEVEKFIATHRRHPPTLPVWPPPGQPLPHYRRVPQSPEVPARIGIEIGSDGAMVWGSFRLSVSSGEALRHEHNKFGYWNPSAIIKISFVITSVRTLVEQIQLVNPSVATPKPAICGHLKTGHSTNVRDKVLYSFSFHKAMKVFDTKVSTLD